MATSRFNPGDTAITLDPGPAAETPIFVRMDPQHRFAEYSESVLDLVPQGSAEPIDSDNVTLLLQSGLVPPPKTVYRNVYMLGPGWTAALASSASGVDIRFHEKPVFQPDDPERVNDPDDDRFLEILAEAALAKVDNARPAFLFHSAGKDSNAIALAIAAAGRQRDVALVTHACRWATTDSDVSKAIANRLGLRHVTLRDPESVDEPQLEQLYDYVSRCPLPCSDLVSSARAFYTEQLPELANRERGATVINGEGNDAYMGCMPSPRATRGAS